MMPLVDHADSTERHVSVTCQQSARPFVVCHCVGQVCAAVSGLSDIENIDNLRVCMDLVDLSCCDCQEALKPNVMLKLVRFRG